MLAGCGGPPVIPVFEDGDRQCELAIYISNSDELWVRLQDPASVTKAERNGRRLPGLALGLYVCVSTQTQTHMPTRNKRAWHWKDPAWI